MTTPDSSSALNPQMDRRAAIKWMAAAAATTALFDRTMLGATSPAAKPASGYGTDPDLLKNYSPGDLWPLTFNASQRATAAVLCDVIIPADAKGPAASTVKVHEFIDEWISAPYPGHADDRKTVIEGLTWLDGESRRRFKSDFVKLAASQQTAICDDICHLPKANAEFRSGAQFFRRFRDLTAGGYYSTPEGMRDIGYTGNVALDKFEGPPPEVLKKLGLI